VVVKAWTSVEVSVPIWAVVSAPTWAVVRVVTSVVVRLPIDVVLRPETCAFESSSRSSALRLPADSALSCVVVRPRVWVVVSAASCVVEKLLTAVVVRPPI
jgi:hypothetical protein